MLAGRGGFLAQRGDALVEFGQVNQLCRGFLKSDRFLCSWQSGRVQHPGIAERQKDERWETSSSTVGSRTEPWPQAVPLGDLCKSSRNAVFCHLSQPLPLF